MDRQQFTEHIKDILSEEFEVDKDLMKDDAPLMATLDLDSLDMVDMVVIVEKHFGFKMVKEDFSRLRTFSDFYDFVIEKSAE